MRIISLDPETTLDSLSLQALTAPPSSIVMAEIVDASIDKYHATLFVNIGLQNGVLLRTVLDPLTGSLGDTRTRFLGSRPVKLARVPVQGQPAILALSSRPWLNYAYRGILQFTPLIFDALDYAWSFSAELCPEGLIGIVGNSLRCVLSCTDLFAWKAVADPANCRPDSIFTFPRLGQKVQQTAIDLSYTPRKLITSPATRLLYTVEADHRTFSPSAMQKTVADMRAAEIEVDEEVLALDPKEFGLPRAGAGQWGSCIRIIDPVTVRFSQTLTLEARRRLLTKVDVTRPNPSSNSTSRTTRRRSPSPSSTSTLTRRKPSSSSAPVRILRSPLGHASRPTCTRTACSTRAAGSNCTTRRKSTTFRRPSSRSRDGCWRVSAKPCDCTTSERRSCCERRRTR